MKRIARLGVRIKQRTTPVQGLNNLLARICNPCLYIIIVQLFVARIASPRQREFYPLCHVAFTLLSKISHLFQFIIFLGYFVNRFFIKYF